MTPDYSNENEGFIVIIKGQYKFWKKFGEVKEHFIKYSSSYPVGIDNPLYHTFRLNDNFDSTYPMFADLIYRESDAKKMVDFLKENYETVLKSFANIEYITYKKYKLVPVAEGEE
jgi:hypothetical protein